MAALIQDERKFALTRWTNLSRAYHTATADIVDQRCHLQTYGVLSRNIFLICMFHYLPKERNVLLENKFQPLHSLERRNLWRALTEAIFQASKFFQTKSLSAKKRMDVVVKADPKSPPKSLPFICSLLQKSGWVDASLMLWSSAWNILSSCLVLALAWLCGVAIHPLSNHLF